jgi:hypothetical protein
MRIILALILLLMLAGSVSAELTVTRDLPDSASTGDEITVTLSIKIDGEIPAGAIVEEKIPEGITYISSTPEATETDTGLKWVLYGSDLKETDLKYVAKVEESADINFEGTYTTLLGTEDISGDSMLKISVRGVKSSEVDKGIPGFELLFAAAGFLIALILRKYR